LKVSSSIDVSIIIVNYKSWKHVDNCLLSLQDYQKLCVDIIVVDNKSNDGKLEEFQSKFPVVNFIENSGNNGFAHGCNFGAKHAKGEYLLFLNPDTIANEEALVRMLDFYKKNPTVGIVSCLQKKVKGGYEKSDRLFLSFLNLFGLTRAFYRLLNKRYLSNKFKVENNVVYPDWVSGSVVFISKEWLYQIGGWNEDYWMYFEDMDLSKKVIEANGKVALLKGAEIIHNHGGASRINVKTAKITKSEVLISKHVYINNQLKGLEKWISLLVLVISNLFFGLILALFGMFFFFIPKLRLKFLLFVELMKYYISSLLNQTWLSSRSMNYRNS